MNRGGGFFNDYSLMKKKKDDAFDIKAVLKHHKQANQSSAMETENQGNSGQMEIEYQKEYDPKDLYYYATRIQIHAKRFLNRRRAFLVELEELEKRLKDLNILLKKMPGIREKCFLNGKTLESTLLKVQII